MTVSKTLANLAIYLKITLNDPLYRLFIVLPLFIMLVIKLVFNNIVAIGESIGARADSVSNVLIYLAAVIAPFGISGVLTGLVLIDERDFRITLVYKTIPREETTIMLQKMIIPAIIATIQCLIASWLFAEVKVTAEKELLLVIDGIIHVPIFALIIYIMSKDKVHALVNQKALSLMYVIPMIRFFFDDWWLNMFIFIPGYTLVAIFSSLDVLNSNELILITIGVFCNVILLLLLLKRSKSHFN